MVNLRPTSGWDRFGSLGHPYKFQRVLRLGSVTARHLVVGVRQTLRRWTEGATYVRQGDHQVVLGLTTRYFCHKRYTLLFGTADFYHQHKKLISPSKTWCVLYVCVLNYKVLHWYLVFCFNCSGDRSGVWWCYCKNVWASEKIWGSSWHYVLPWRWIRYW